MGCAVSCIISLLALKCANLLSALLLLFISVGLLLTLAFLQSLLVLMIEEL